MEKVTDVRDYVANYELNEYSYQNFWKGREYEHLVEVALLKQIFSRFVPNAKARTVVDLGGAYGRLLPVFGNLARHVVLADYSTRELQEGKAHIEKTQFKNKVSYIALNAYRLPFKDDSIDALVSVRVMHHLKDLPVFFEQLARTLVPGGIAVIEFANKNHFLALARNILRGNFEYLRKQVHQVEHRSESSQGMKAGQVAIMYNFSPNYVVETAKGVGLSVQGTFACSFLRLPVLKKLVPTKVLVFLETVMRSVAWWLLITPSVFVVLKKNGEFVPKEDQVDVLQCPTCGAPIVARESQYICSNKHIFPQADSQLVDLRDPRPERVDF